MGTPDGVPLWVLATELFTWDWIEVKKGIVWMPDHYDRHWRADHGSPQSSSPHSAYAPFRYLEDHIFIDILMPGMKVFIDHANITPLRYPLGFGFARSGRIRFPGPVRRLLPDGMASLCITSRGTSPRYCRHLRVLGF
ncbi:hypothetical protein Pdw03_5211 [Penicillium digitatum]|uniref:Uncharacterized protein n=1 Tax=Penicillium digitatum TaxID=36651 RepID=A0A7T6XUN4_PENDI|nr:hypothetical protein Pdw03_5211 [Penicillium digitatum]